MAYQNLSGWIDAPSTKFFWTVEAYEYLEKNNAYVRINTSSKNVDKENLIDYRVRVWYNASQGAISPTGTIPVPVYDSDVEVNVLDSWRTANAENFEILEPVGPVGPVGQVSAGSLTPRYPKRNPAEFPYYTDNNDHGNNSKEIFVFTIKAKKASVTVAPKIFVKLKPNSTLNPLSYGLEVLPYNEPPSVYFTAAKKDPQVPDKAKDAAWGQNLIALDKCTNPNRWAVITREGYEQDRSPASSFAAEYYEKWYLKFYPLNADTLTEAELKKQTEIIYLGEDLSKAAKAAKDPLHPYGSDKVNTAAIAVQRIAEIKAGGCGNPADDPNAKDDGINTENSRPVEFSVDTRTNPPNHFVTRNVSHWTKIRSSLEKGEFGGKRANYLIDRNKIDLLKFDTTSAGKLGMIFQDAESAKALNLDTKIPWGFRFIYNPTSISYSTAMDTSIDWMLADKDPANYIGGNVTVGMTLYLNRVADMTELAGSKGKDSDYGPAGAYPRALRPEEVNGLLYRGTEYDLEFLYRVVNGDPKPSTNSLLSYTVGGQAPLTSDFGYITGTPVWLKIHNNLRYKVSVASVTVNHVIFNELMIPMFSTVDIQMIRYPVISDTNSEVQDAFTKEKTKYVANLTKEAEGTPKP